MLNPLRLLRIFFLRIFFLRVSNPHNENPDFAPSHYYLKKKRVKFWTEQEVENSYNRP